MNGRTVKKLGGTIRRACGDVTTPEQTLKVRGS
jgi:hypothetical protein